MCSGTFAVLLTIELHFSFLNLPDKDWASHHVIEQCGRVLGFIVLQCGFCGTMQVHIDRNNMNIVVEVSVMTLIYFVDLLMVHHQIYEALYLMLNVEEDRGYIVLVQRDNGEIVPSQQHRKINLELNSSNTQYVTNFQHFKGPANNQIPLSHQPKI